MTDVALAIEAAQRLADYVIENGAAEEGVHEDLRIIEAPVRQLQQQEAHPIPRGWEIHNGWIIEPLTDGRTGDHLSPADDVQPLFNLRLLPGWTTFVREVREGVIS